MKKRADFRIQGREAYGDKTIAYSIYNNNLTWKEFKERITELIKDLNNGKK